MTSRIFVNMISEVDKLYATVMPSVYMYYDVLPSLTLHPDSTLVLPN